MCSDEVMNRCSVMTRKSSNVSRIIFVASGEFGRFDFGRSTQEKQCDITLFMSLVDEPMEVLDMITSRTLPSSLQLSLASESRR